MVIQNCVYAKPNKNTALCICIVYFTHMRCCTYGAHCTVSFDLIRWRVSFLFCLILFDAFSVVPVRLYIFFCFFFLFEHSLSKLFSVCLKFVFFSFSPLYPCIYANIRSCARKLLHLHHKRRTKWNQTRIVVECTWCLYDPAIELEKKKNQTFT